MWRAAQRKALTIESAPRRRETLAAAARPAPPPPARPLLDDDSDVHLDLANSWRAARENSESDDDGWDDGDGG